MDGLTVRYADDSLVVADKPAGLLSVPGKGPEKADCAVARAAASWGWIREAHRLDQATSGLLVLARTPESHRELSRAFAERRVEKAYTALTAALPADPQRDGIRFTVENGGLSGRIVVFQRLDPHHRPRQVVDAVDGKKAVTLWRTAGSGGEAGAPGPGDGMSGERPPIAGREGRAVCAAGEDSRRGNGAFRLELGLLTGRTHQLRLALAVCGAPILGDGLYAPPGVCGLSPRLMLHARYLRFPHPVTGEDVEVISNPEF